VKAFPSAGVDLRLTRNVLGSLEETSFKANVIELAKHHAQKCGGTVRLIVFDHARLVMDGNPDDAADVTQLTRVLTSIAQETGAAVMLLAHSPKSVLKQQAKEMTVADVAGSSAFSDNARSGFIMYGMREDDAKTYQISDSDRKKYVKLECAKSNYSIQGTEWWFERLPLPEWQTAVLKPAILSRLMFSPGQAKQKLRQKIIDLLINSPGQSARFIRDQSGRSRSLAASEKEVSTVVDALIQEGRIERRKPTQSEAVQLKLPKGRELLFVVSSHS
jgi:RecA-family ATPase